MRVFSIIGSCRDKAVLVQQLIAHLQELDFTVSTIKRVSDDVDLDRPGKDTYLQRHAGAREIVIANSFRSAILEEYAQAQDEPDIEMLLSRLKPADVVLLEGFRLCAYPKLEVIGPNQGRRPLYHDDHSVIAIAGAVSGPSAAKPDEAELRSVRCFDLADISAIALFVLAQAALPGLACQETAA
ncbi:MAG TPA: molybdopterin-guanine dinucleotide biosynthesis protein B [Terriglobia bacterium]|nr:molybdopterin-guanine dinucleotide biosynthesis protein B [Terriglobia bacterium]